MMKPRPLRRLQLVEDLAQPAALLVVVDLARHADAVEAGHQHEIAAGDADVGAQRRPLGADAFLDDLDEDFLAALEDVLDERLGPADARPAAAARAVAAAGRDRGRGRGRSRRRRVRPASRRSRSPRGPSSGARPRASDRSGGSSGSNSASTGRPRFLGEAGIAVVSPRSPDLGGFQVGGEIVLDAAATLRRRRTTRGGGEIGLLGRLDVLLGRFALRRSGSSDRRGGRPDGGLPRSRGKNSRSSSPMPESLPTG